MIRIFLYLDVREYEKFIGMKPDLELIRSMIGIGYKPFGGKKLEVAGITVVSLQPKSVTEMYIYERG